MNPAMAMMTRTTPRIIQGLTVNPVAGNRVPAVVAMAGCDSSPSGGGMVSGGASAGATANAKGGTRRRATRIRNTRMEAFILSPWKIGHLPGR
ncbi:MAG: hypothetical protein LUQ01_01440 [Methanolinea sp.]|nr:hypothetical protein [Methanolinea sp.]